MSETQAFSVHRRSGTVASATAAGVQPATSARQRQEQQQQSPLDTKSIRSQTARLLAVKVNSDLTVSAAESLLTTNNSTMETPILYQEELSLPVEAVASTTTTTSVEQESTATTVNKVLGFVQEKIGTVDEERLLFPEYGEDVPRLFSSLEYTTNDNNQNNVVATHAAGSVVGAAALVAGTTIGAGVLALPTATAAAGFVPSSAAMLLAYVYMTMSGLFIAELTLNRIGRTGRPGLGPLELYDGSLGQPLAAVGTAAYFFLHYAIMVAYIAQGGANLEGVLPDIQGTGSLAFAAVVGAALFAAPTSVVEKVNNGMVLGVGASFVGIMALAAQTADFGTLVDPAYQHPEQVVSSFPILFLALVYQNVVPTVVTQLEGDRDKITKAIVGGTTAPLIMFLAWNAVCLGNVLGTDVDLSQVDPVALLQSGQAGGDVALLAPLVTIFSSLALITSVIGFTYGLVDAWTDVFDINTKSADYEKYKAGLFALVFAPPLVLSMLDPDIFYRALEYGGAFGVSTLFLVLPPVMVWKERYSDTDTPLVTTPMVPFGKIPLGAMWKASLTLIAEQGAEKLGFFDWVQQYLPHESI